MHRLADLKGPKGTLVMFICNHCPYVKAVITDVVKDAAALAAEGVNTVAVMPNDTVSYPDDSFDNMKAFARQHGFGFPYVIDRTQKVARSYGAECTPDFFGFDKDLKLRYRGRMYEMEAGLKPKPGARHELLEAMRQIAATGEGPKDQTPSMGCSIKWRD
jgi:threonine dehydrogenase-like Zn-dependent dehydrogenase